MERAKKLETVEKADEVLLEEIRELKVIPLKLIRTPNMEFFCFSESFNLSQWPVVRCRRRMQF